MRIFFIGDIVGRPGRNAVIELLPKIRVSEQIDFCIANAENAAGGKGITPEIANLLFQAGVDVITGGNHIWKKKEILSIIDSEPRLLRPANYPAGVPGRGAGLYIIRKNQTEIKIGVIHISGRVFSQTLLDCPFKVAKSEVMQLKQKTSIIIVDIHGEATSEKMAIGWYLDGEVSAVLGTHTHIPTADARILPGGTAYITDVGMTGPFDSVIGVKKEIILEMFLTQMPVKHEVATDNVQLNAVIIDIDEITGKSQRIERYHLKI